jgi:hypothetical protein
MYPAMSAYLIGEISSRDYYAMTPVNNENVQIKTQLFNGAVANFNRTFTYLDDDYVFRAVLGIGTLQEDFANAVGFMDPPSDLTPEGEEEFYNVLMEVYDTYIQRATSTYENGLQLAVTNGIRTDYTDSIAVRLDLLLPGYSTDLGYYSVTTDSLGVSDTTFSIPDTGIQTDETGEEQQTGESGGQELPDVPADATEPDYYIQEEEEQGGGCFLWPF